MAQIYDFSLLRPNNPMRPPDWRWRRALHLTPNHLPTRFEDKYIIEAIKFIRAERNGVSSAILSSHFPIIYEVSRIFMNGDHVRHIIEALILANTPPQEILRRFGWSDEDGQKIVETYEALFFDVRTRLSFDGFIRTYVLGGGALSCANSEDNILKSLGYMGFRKKVGHALVDCYLDLDVLSGDVRKWFESLIDSQFTKKTLRAVMKGDPLRSPLLMDAMRAHNENRRIALEQRIKGIEINSDGDKRQAELLEALQITAASITDVMHSSIEGQIARQLPELSEDKIANQIAETLKENRNSKTQPVTIDTSATPLN